MTYLEAHRAEKWKPSTKPQCFSVFFSFSSFHEDLTLSVYMGRIRDYDPEKAMAPYSSTLAWKIPWMEEPGRL